MNVIFLKTDFRKSDFLTFADANANIAKGIRNFF